MATCVLAAGAPRRPLGRATGKQIYHDQCASGAYDYALMARETRSSKQPPPAEAEKWREQYRLSHTLSFMRLLWAVAHGLRSWSKRMQGEIGITGPQRLALRIIGKFPNRMPSELAALMHLDRGTLSGIVERLVVQDLLTRKPHEVDGRSVTLQLTARGRSLARVTAGTVEDSVRRALGRLPRSKVEIAAEVLEAVARGLIRDESDEDDSSE